MSDWVALNQLELNTPREEHVQGISINMRLSPYDVPEAVRGYYDKSLERFVIEFRYIGDEPKEIKEYGEYLKLKIGKNSDRLYGIEVNVDAIRSRSVHSQSVPELLQQAINSLAENRELRRAHYELADRVISDGKNQVLKGLAPA